MYTVEKADPLHYESEVEEKNIDVVGNGDWGREAKS